MGQGLFLPNGDVHVPARAITVPARVITFAGSTVLARVVPMVAHAIAGKAIRHFRRLEWESAGPN